MNMINLKFVSSLKKSGIFVGDTLSLILFILFPYSNIQKTFKTRTVYFNMPFTLPINILLHFPFLMFVCI